MEKETYNRAKEAVRELAHIHDETGLVGIYLDPQEIHLRPLAMAQLFDPDEWEWTFHYGDWGEGRKDDSMDAFVVDEDFHVFCIVEADDAPGWGGPTVEELEARDEQRRH